MVATSFAGAVALLAATGFAAAEEHVRLKFDNCTTAQQLQISKAITLANDAIDVAVARLNEDKPEAEDANAIVRWFGARTSGQAIAGKLVHIGERLDYDAQAIVAECDANNRDTFAWTYRAMDGVGYLGFGQPFFDAAAIGGFDSRMGTIVHELSHMVPEIAADDLSYLIPQMEAYARDNPKLAFDNAQNYEYLVEQLLDISMFGHASSFIVS